jgi:hypothetical protein
VTDLEYSNGADGSCQECGEATDEEWHVYCSDCYAQEQGWRTSSADADALAAQAEDRAKVTLTRALARIDDLEARVDRLEDRR